MPRMAQNTTQPHPYVEQLAKQMDEARQRRARILRLHKQGKSLSQIATILGKISRQRVQVLLVEAKHEAGKVG